MSKLKRQVDALHTKQEEVQQGQETILSELKKRNGLVSSLGNDVNEVTRLFTLSSNLHLIVGRLGILLNDVGVVCSSPLLLSAVPMISLMNSKALAVVEFAATNGAALQLMGASRAARGRQLR